jgi:hypothetical protein
MIMIIIGSLLVAAVLGYAIGRRAVLAGWFFLVLGVGPFAALYVYETFIYTTGDTSAIGMLSTMALILFAPFGLVLVLFGFLGGD